MDQYHWGGCCNTFCQETYLLQLEKNSFFGRQKTPSDCEQALICSSNSLIFAKQAIHREHLTGLQSFNELQIFTAEYAVSPQVIVQLYRAAGKKLLATSLHAGWMCQANTWWHVVSYCTEYQAAGSAHRPSLIFYLHSLLLRISGQFSRLFTVNKLQSKARVSGRHVE